MLLTILGAALLAVLIAMIRGPNRRGAVPSPGPPATPVPDAKPLELEAWDARKGDVISLKAAAEDFADIDLPVDRRSAYEANNRRWLSLSGDFRGRQVFLEVYRYPTSEVIGFLDTRSFNIADLGLTEEQLVDLDTRQDPSATISFDNATWRYESSREIAYLEGETGAPVGLYRWVFEEQNGKRLLCVEKWEGEPFRVRLARHLEDRDITVYRAG